MVSVIIQDVLVVGCVGGSEKRSRIQPVGGDARFHRHHHHGVMLVSQSVSRRVRCRTVDRDADDYSEVTSIWTS